jgi:hypothetical protein
MITRDKVLRIQEKLKAAIKQIETEENVQFDFGAINFNPQRYQTNFTVKTLEKSDKVESIMEITCKSIGFTQNVIGMNFQFKGSKYEITDIKTKNRKYPVIAIDLSSKTSYKFSVETIKGLLGGDKIINRNKNLDKLID